MGSQKVGHNLATEQQQYQKEDFSQSVQLLSHVRLSDLMNCNTPGLLVHHQLLELIQTHVLRIGDAIQPSPPLPSPSPLALNLSQHQIRIFSSESVLCISIRCKVSIIAKVLELQL